MASSLSLQDRRLRARGYGFRARLFARGKRFILIPGTKAVLTTALTGANNDLTYTAVQPGAAGNSVTIRYVVAGTSTPLSVSVNKETRAITVNVATDGAGAATSTAAAVRNAVNAHAEAQNIVQTANAAANDGTGVVTALAATPLATGTG